MAQQTFINNQFLIAMPNMEDPIFKSSVSYICEHNQEGAVGIVISRPIEEVFLKHLFTQMSIEDADHTAGNIPVYYGGPVQQDRGFVLHDPSRQWRSTIQISDEVAITTSRDVLEAIARKEGPLEVFVSLGYAGWGPGQLEEEIKDNVWLNCPADKNLIFHLPHQERWLAATKLLGIDLAYLSQDVGHA